ncbi:hypothetical protein [Streptomyces sp. SM11]|uniref:hypothetical protein n=1 Tax=Streptomyces sp. SM11 TaxID=565557 RepID=UPI000CD53043|nr:hypothetical protein [Streptomyces sp. SM11]
MTRYKRIDGHLVDTHSGVIVTELPPARATTRRTTSPRRRVRKSPRVQLQYDVAIAAGVVLGCWLPFVLGR